jgi:[ribosomal protein S5]-alanine N-acetyltransferase
MRLVPASVALARAELMDRPGFARLLSAVVPDQWPPEILADALPTFLEFIEAAPDQVGWFVWYAIIRGSDPTPDVLAASGGFKGPPEDGTVELGYSALPEFQGQGYATEMVRALVDWAFSQPDVRQIVAETTEDNLPSMRLLRRLGFTDANPAIEPDHVRLAIDRRDANGP